MNNLDIYYEMYKEIARLQPDETLELVLVNSIEFNVYRIYF